ncbi:MAG: pyruvate dehydrogenase [Bdellovibrionaceae bacterium]|nr:pyruvate dehydrogenase [Bdellovibrionales bacterium]MCB9086356.1 pyruvate dehydrogenase [Pseudobdellovibrionaceae bacterium]
MIYIANHRSDKAKGDPKVGGHPAACSSALHILGALHLVVKSGYDHIANKPHASPTDHAYSYLLDLHLHKDLSKLTLEESNKAMHGLRAFPQAGEDVFQSYHSTYDPDHHNFFPSGTVGIPPVKAGYLALAYRYAREHGYNVPDAHFWSVVGDAEFREGSLFEAIPDFAERELGQLTWIIDYNRQSLDGHRITNKEIMGGTDDDRIQRTAEANGWEVIQVRHGRKRQEIFAKKGGDALKQWLEEDLSDYGLQVLLQLPDGAALRTELEKNHPKISGFIGSLSDREVFDAIRDLGGHDFAVLVEALEKSKENPRRPCMIIAHTLKGWGLKMAATPGNHSALPDADEVEELKQKVGITNPDPFVRFAENSDEGRYLRERGSSLYQDIKGQHELKELNKRMFLDQLERNGGVPTSLGISLKLASYPHTQWMLGQLTAKLTRIANTPLDPAQLKAKQKALTPQEIAFKQAGEMMVAMAPDVGTSTNLNPAMDGHIFGAYVEDDYEAAVGVKDSKTPDLIPGEQSDDRYLRFEIAEGNVMSCMGAYGRMRDTLGIPLMPLMTVYDFFIKRALDQYFYDLYWQSSFILCGTPSGITLSPEGAQHGWKSDLQVPNQITWEPYFCQELDWILCESMHRHLTYDNQGRSGVIIRGVTRGIEQKDFLKYLSRQRRFKTGLDEGTSLSPADIEIPGCISVNDVATIDEDSMMETVRQDVLAGAYYLIDYRGYAGYEPGDNVVNLFAMGAMTKEAIEASEILLKKGVYANVVVVTSPDLLVGNLGHETDYSHLRITLGVNGNLHLVPYLNGSTERAEMATLAGRRIPVVSVHDGEPGLLDNLGSIIGVRHESLAVRKHSRCGRPVDVYAYHGIDEVAIVEACGKVLSETALEQVEVSRRVLHETAVSESTIGNWRELWPGKDS